jgi:hypothetical protein
LSKRAGRAIARQEAPTEHQDGDGEALYRAACKAGLVGIAAKFKEAATRVAGLRLG